MLEQEIEQDLKQALLSRDDRRVSVLRGLKSTLLYAKMAVGKKDQALPDVEVVSVLSKEAKKRQESVDLYQKGGDQTRADSELAEKSIIEEYLPKALSEEEIRTVVDEVVNSLDTQAPSAMGQAISVIKQKTAGAADGATIARLVKERLAQ